jgi:Clostridium P-47 protein
MSNTIAPAAPADTGTAVYTYGWDTAFAIPVPDVNRAIVDHKSSPAGFSQTEHTFSVTADFGHWQITPGGDGKAVRLLLPLSNVRLTYTKTGKVIKCPTGQAVVEVELHYIPHTGDAAADASPADGNPFALVVKDTATSVDVPVMSVISMTLDPEPGDPAPGPVSRALIRESLKDWGNANLAEFSHVFTVVNLNRMVDKGQWGFVNPNYTSYAYLDMGSVESSIFAVLCMTADRTGETLSEQVSEAAIPRGSVGGFLISQARTLQDLVRPAIMQAYPGLTDENFLLNGDATKLYLTDGTSVALTPVTKDGTPYQPYLKQLTVQSNGQILTLNSYTETDIVLGITATCTATHWYTMGLGTSGNGQTIVFQEAQAPSIVHAITQNPGSQLTKLIIELVVALALLILGLLTDGAALILGGLAIGLLLGADQIVMAHIEKVNKDDSPAIDLLLVNSVHPIKWSDSQDFKLGYGSLNMSLQLGGDPTFV